MDSLDAKPFTDEDLERFQRSGGPDEQRWIVTVLALKARIAQLQEVQQELDPSPTDRELEQAKARLPTWHPVIALHDADATIDLQDRDDGHSHHYVPASSLAEARARVKQLEGKVHRLMDALATIAGRAEAMHPAETKTEEGV